jgi:hypothetical protein
LEEPAYPADTHDYSSDAEELEGIDAAMGEAPRGALIVSGIAVALLIICWLIIYAFIFIPRGMVG